VVLPELLAADDKAAALDRQLAKHGVERAWWDELSGRVAMAALVARVNVGAPVSDTLAADGETIAPYRDRIRALLVEHRAPAEQETEVVEGALFGAEEPRPAVPLRPADVEAYLAIMPALLAADDKAAALKEQLAKHRMARRWWDRISGRITMAADGASVPIDAPASGTLSADAEAIAPYRDRIRALLVK
jgi:hypothetical protein